MDDWRDRAACRGGNVDWFHPPEGTPAAERDALYLKARGVCASCSAVSDCLAEGLTGQVSFGDDRTYGQLTGIWGGTDEAERAWMRSADADEMAELQPLAVMLPETADRQAFRVFGPGRCQVEAPDASTWMTSSVSEVAARLGVSAKQASQWKREAYPRGLPWRVAARDAIKGRAQISKAELHSIIQRTIPDWVIAARVERDKRNRSPVSIRKVMTVTEIDWLCRRAGLAERSPDGRHLIVNSADVRRS